MFYTVYKITNKINGKFYIGKHQTLNLSDNYMGSGKLLQRAYEKHGIENFQKDILFVFDNADEMNKKEKELVVINEHTYNLCPGGHGGFGYINSNKLNRYATHKEKSIENLTKGSQQLKEYFASGKHPELMKNVVNKWMKEKYPKGVWKGKKHKDATIEKMKGHNRQVGSKNSQFGTVWITDGKENKKVSKNDIDKYLMLGYIKGRIFKDP